MNDKTTRLAWPAVSIACIGLIAQGCSSGSGGSEVGNNAGIAPTARAQVLNGGETNTFREGSEVLLSGKDSEDADGPLLHWEWQQTAGPSVQLVERNAVAVSFTAPPVTGATELAFELTVEDSSRSTGRTSVAVTVVPSKDADKFLSLDVRGAGRDTFDDFQVVAALAEGASTDGTSKPFTLSGLAYLVYPPRSAPNADCVVDPTEFATRIPDSVASGCAVALLEDLTPFALPGGGTGLQGEWPANVPVVVRPNGPTADQISAEWWNPHFTLQIPRLDVDDFNQQFVDSGERGRLLDQFNAARSKIYLVFELNAPQNQQDATLVVNDLESAPIVAPSQAKPKTAQAQGKIVVNDGVGMPTRAVVDQDAVLGAIAGRESALTSEVYYRTVDANGARMTLNAWLQHAGFTDDEGKLLPEAVAGSGDFAHAIYMNNYDLGLGRDMTTRMDEFGNVYSYVVNYGTLEGAIRRNDPIVTVVMEYSPLGAPADPGDKFVKFFTYVEDGSGDSRRVSSMNFDGRGERYTPGNCIACHGGDKPPGVSELLFDATCGDRSDAMCYTWPATNRDGADISNGNLSATFLPWDLDSFLFADTDPAITDAPGRFDGLSLTDRLIHDHGDYSRSVQEAQFKKLNEAAHATYCDAAVVPDCRSDAARRLVEHWYGGVDQDGHLIGEFDDTAAPPGWQNDELVTDPAGSGTPIQNPGDAEGLYLQVYARHCRMCHTNIAMESLRFDTYQKLAAFAPQVEDLVFRRGAMPAARLTMDRFWVPQDGSAVPAAMLAAHLGLSEDAAAGPRPFVDIAQPATATAARHVPVRLTARDNAFADSFDWSVAYTPPAELAGSSAVLGFAPVLIGNGTPDIAFVAGKPGTYTATVVINDPDVSLPLPDGFTDSETVTVQNFVPLACNDVGSTEPGGAPVPISFLQNDRFALAGSGDGCAAADLVSLGDGADVPLTYAFTSVFNQNGQFTTPNGGTFTLDIAEACEVTAPLGCGDDVLVYTPSNSGDSYVDTIEYRITDADEELSEIGTITVEVTADLEVNAQAAANVLSESTRLLTLSISGGAPADPGEMRYTVTLTAPPVRGTVMRSGVPISPGGSFQTNGGVLLSYVSDDFATGAENMQFTVTDSDSSMDAGAFGFQVLPQAPFKNSGALAAGQTAVMDQWASTADSKTNCLTGCHGAGGLGQERFNMAGGDLAVYNALVSGASSDGFGSTKVVAGLAQRQNNPDASIILCYPSGAGCSAPPAGNPHDGGDALPPLSTSYGVIRRWIQENAQFN